MSAQPSPPGHDQISNFCSHVIATHGARWPVDENTIASEFVMLPGAQDCISDSQLVDLCSRLFVDVQWVDLPPGNSGINVCYGDRRTIFVRKAEFPGLREHVLLHELREIFEYKFRELGHPLAKNDIEQRAEAFAVLVRMRSATAAWFTFFEYADNLQSPWQRIAACILVAAGAMVNLICTAMAGPLLDSSAATSCSFAD